MKLLALEVIDLSLIKKAFRIIPMFNLVMKELHSKNPWLNRPTQESKSDPRLIPS